MTREIVIEAAQGGVLKLAVAILVQMLAVPIAVWAHQRLRSIHHGEPWRSLSGVFERWYGGECRPLYDDLVAATGDRWTRPIRSAIAALFALVWLLVDTLADEDVRRWHADVVAHPWWVVPWRVFDAVDLLLGGHLLTRLTYFIATSLYGLAAAVMVLAGDPESAAGAAVGAAIFGVSYVLARAGHPPILPVSAAAIWAAASLAWSMGWNQGGILPFALSRLGLAFVLAGTALYVLRTTVSIALFSAYARATEGDASAAPLGVRVAEWSLRSRAPSVIALVATTLLCMAAMLEALLADFSIVRTVGSLTGSAAFWAGTAGFAVVASRWDHGVAE